MPKLKKRGLDSIGNKDKRLYYLRVWLVTEMQPLHKLRNHKKRCWNHSGCYELDHILSIAHSYLEKIPPHMVGLWITLDLYLKKKIETKVLG